MAIMSNDDDIVCIPDSTVDFQSDEHVAVVVAEAVHIEEISIDEMDHDNGTGYDKPVDYVDEDDDYDNKEESAVLPVASAPIMDGHIQFEFPQLLTIKRNDFPDDGKSSHEILMGTKTIKKTWTRVQLKRGDELTNPDDKVLLAILDSDDRPLLCLKHKDESHRGLAIDICRYDTTTPSLTTTVPICRVHRHSNKKTIHDRYKIYLYDWLEKNHPPIHVDGKYPVRFTLSNGDSLSTSWGEVYAKIKKKGNEWSMDLSAGTDAILFIGIVCALDGLHHEAVNEKQAYGKLGAKLIKKFT